MRLNCKTHPRKVLHNLACPKMSPQALMNASDVRSQLRSRCHRNLQAQRDRLENSVSTGSAVRTGDRILTTIGNATTNAPAVVQICISLQSISILATVRTRETYRNSTTFRRLCLEKSHCQAMCLLLKTTFVKNLRRHNQKSVTKRSPNPHKKRELQPSALSQIPRQVLASKAKKYSRELEHEPAPSDQSTDYRGR